MSFTRPKPPTAGGAPEFNPQRPQPQSQPTTTPEAATSQPPVQYVLQEVRPPVSSSGIASMVLGLLAPGGILILFVLSALTGAGFSGGVWLFILPSVAFAAFSILLGALSKKRIESGKERGAGFGATGIFVSVLVLPAAAFMAWQFLQLTEQAGNRVTIDELGGGTTIEELGGDPAPVDEGGKTDGFDGELIKELGD